MRIPPMPPRDDRPAGEQGFVSLRDTFAAAALTGLLANPRHDEDNIEEICHWAWSWADAMLRERERTKHDAVPAARAQLPEGVHASEGGGSDRTDKAAPRPAVGTGNTQEGREIGPELVARIRHVADSLEAIARGEVDSPQPFAAAYAVYLHGEYDSSYGPDSIDEALEIAAECSGEVVPLYRTPQSHATPGEGSVRRNGSVESRETVQQEPVAWAILHQDHQYVSLLREHAQAHQVYTDAEIVPLYRSPTLTDEERFVLREVRDIYADEDDVKCNEIAAVIDGLLERTK
jgi:hypothetical protein